MPETIKTAQQRWNDDEPVSRRICGTTVWWAKAWPWPQERPLAGSGSTRREALESLRLIIAQELKIA